MTTPNSNSTKIAHLLGGSLILALAPVALAQVTPGLGESPERMPSGEWSSICAAYEAGRHKAFESEEGHQARNPGQHWLTTFDGQGFLVQPNDGEWSWGLELQAFGFKGAMQEFPDSAAVCVEDNRVVYGWSESVDEWYVNDARGVEHGFTIWQRPEIGAIEGAPLTLDLVVQGSLKAEAYADGSGVCFATAGGGTELTYSGLMVFDADGKAQAANLSVKGSCLRISIEESGARYPLTIDPVAQQAYLKASNTDAGDSFGGSVAISGNLIVVGAWGEDSSATGINGNQSSGSAPNSGAAYVFERVNGAWSQSTYVKASNAGAYDRFGSSVAISGDLVIVGAPYEGSNATGVNGNQSDNSWGTAGAAYVFERSGGAWTQLAYLKASNTGIDDLFGISVAISGDQAVVGAMRENSNATGVNGNQSDNSMGDSGAAYVFERSNGAWSQQAYLKASNTDPGDWFGNVVAISGDSIVVGAISEDGNTTGINGVQSDNSAFNAGAAFVFGRSNGAWSQQAYLKASNTDANDLFGSSVGISEDLIVVGAVAESSNATGVNGNQNDNSIPASGAAYVFERSGGTWNQQAYLKASNPGSGDLFGITAISGERILVAARLEDSSALGINGDQSDNSATDSGSGYAFERVSGVWEERAYLKASNAGSIDQFGVSVGISGDLAVLGAYGERSNATGVNGNQNDNSAQVSGAAYAFDLASPIANYCSPAISNSSGFPAEMSLSGSQVVANNSFTLRATGVPVNQFGYFLSSTGQDFVPNPGIYQGNLCLGGGAPIGRHHSSVQSSGATGVIQFTLDLNNVPTPMGPTTIQAGETWNFQCWFRDDNPGDTSNFSDGLQVLFE